jgi:myosin I
VPRDDVYKSSTVHVPRGLPPNSESRPTPRGRSARPYAAQPDVTQSYAKPRTASLTSPTQSRRSPGFSQTVPQAVRVTQPPATRTSRQPPPPPPPPPPPTLPPAPAQPIYRALYDFNGQTPSEMSFSKGEILEITEKEGNGKSRLSRSNSRMVARKTG